MPPITSSCGANPFCTESDVPGWLLLNPPFLAVPLTFINWNSFSDSLSFFHFDFLLSPLGDLKLVQLELFSITSCAAAHNLLRWRELDPHFGVSVKIFFQLNLTYCDGFISSVDHLGSFSILLWIWIGGSKSLHVSLLSPLGDLEIGPTGIV